KPNVSVEELMNVIKGPDFPTGGIIQGVDGIKKAYKSGKGRIIVRGKAKIEEMRGNRQQIVIDEIPYDVNKANMVKKIDELRIDKKVEGIAEVRDETDRTGLRIVIELKKDVNGEGVLNYLYKNTDLQVAYNFNMVAIQDKTPKLLSLPEILDAYIQHQKEVVTRQTKFDLSQAKKREHIVEGLIKAISILDELIDTIRASKNKQDAKNRIMEKYDFSEAQAEAIVMLQLYRLTNTDITQLKQEAEELEKLIAELKSVLASEKKLLSTVKKDLKEVKKKYRSKRLTVIEDEIEELTIDIEVTVPSEDVLVSVTREGYVKRTSLRSYGASNEKDFTMRDDDYLIRLFEVNTTDNLLLFTNKGKFIFIPVYELPDIRWKDIGQHVSNIVSIDRDEYIIQGLPVRDFNSEDFLIFFTKNGMVKKSKLKLYEAQRYSRALIAMNLKEEDQVVHVARTTGKSDILISTNTGYVLWYDETEVSPVGQRAAGVKSIQLKENEYVVNGQVFDESSNPSLVVVTQRGACKRMSLRDFEKSSRARRGLIMLRELKSKPHRIKGFFVINDNDTIIFQTEKEEIHQIFPLE